MFMAITNKIKYTGSNEILNGAITNNNVNLGVDIDLDYGETRNTGYWAGVNPNNSGYTIYYLNGEDQPRIEVAQNDAALIFFANSFGAPGAANVHEALQFFKSTPGYFITNKKVDSITTSGMTLMYDPGLVQSYPKSGTTMDNLGTLAAGANTPQMTFEPVGVPVEFVDEKGGSLRFYNYGDGDGSYAKTTFSGSSTHFTYNVWFKVNSFTTQTWNVITSRDNYQQIGIFTNGGNGYIDFYENNYNVDLYDETGQPQVIIGKWHNVTVRHIEGETTQLYLDNVFLAEDTTNVNLFNTNMTGFTIGGTNIIPDFFDGQIGHVALYDRALSVAEIEKNYNALHNRYYGAMAGETVMLLSEMPNTNNFGYVILDAATGTASGPFDTYVDRTDYQEWDILSVNHGGYTLMFNNNNNGNIYKVLFVDALGTIVETFDRTTSDFNYDRVDGFINIITDSDAGLIKFFDGTAVGEYTWDTGLEDAYWDWNWDPTSKNKTFVIYTRNYNTNMVTWKLANAQTGVVSLPSYNNNDFDTEPMLYTSGNFVVLPMYNNNTSLYSSIEIYGTDGTLKHSESLSGFTFDSWSGEFFGSGKFSLLYRHYNDENVDYKIFSYTESTNSFVSTTHVRGYNFRDYNTYSQSLNYPNEDTDSNSIHYMFYGDYNDSNNLWDMNYVSYVSLFDGETNFITNVLASGSTVSIAWDGDDTKYYNDLVNTGDGKLKSMLVKPDGFHYTEILADASRLSGYNRRTLNNDMFWRLWLDGAYNTYNYYFINGTTGAIRDTLTFSTTDTYRDSYRTEFDSIYIRNTESQNQGWYLCRNQPTFTSIGYYDYIRSINNTFINDSNWSNPGIIVMYNPNGDRTCRILSPTGISNEFTLPESQSQGWDLEIGNTFIGWRYNTMSDNLPAMRLYDFSGNTINDYVSPISGDNGWSFWNQGVDGNIAYVVAGEGGLNINQWGTLVPTILNADGTYSSQTIRQNNIGSHWITGTDYFWWDC